MATIERKRQTDCPQPVEPVADEHLGFKKLEGKLAHRKGVTNPKALAAAIGREKYGAKAMAKKSAAGRARDVQPVPEMKAR